MNACPSCEFLAFRAGTHLLDRLSTINMQSIDMHQPGNYRVVVVGPERAVRIPYRFRPSPDGAWVTLQPAPHVRAHEIEEARTCLLRGHRIAGIRIGSWKHRKDK